MNIQDTRELSNEELLAQRRDLKQEIINLRVQQQSGQLENPARLRTVRRTIARIETVLAERRSGVAAGA